MHATSSRLDLIMVPVPCPVGWDNLISNPWDAVTGNDRVRYCGQCRQHGYNLSDMSRDEAEALVKEREGRLCVRFYHRPDGTVITRDCQRSPLTTRRVMAAAVGVLVLLLGLIAVRLFAADKQKPLAKRVREVEPFRTVLNWLYPVPTPMPPTTFVVTGDIRVPPPPGNGPPTPP